MSVLFGCIIELILAGGLVQRGFKKHGTKRFNGAKMKRRCDTRSYEIYVGYTGLHFSLNPSRRTMRQHFTKAIQLQQFIVICKEV